MTDTGDPRYEVGFRAECNNPRHHRDGEHAGTNSQRWGSKADTGVVQWLRDETVERHEDESCKDDKHCAETGELKLSFPIPQNREWSVEDESDQCKGIVERSEREIRQRFFRFLLGQLTASGKKLP